jgi:hypothetical protein
MPRSKQNTRKTSPAMTTTTKRGRSSDEEDAPPSKHRAVWDEAAFTQLLAHHRPEDVHECQVGVRAGQRCDASVLKPGALLYRYARIVVLETTDDSARVRNQDLHAQGQTADWQLDTKLINQQCWSPDQYTTVVPVTMTQMAANIKEEVRDSICRVEFTKQPDSAVMAELIQQGVAMLDASDLSPSEKKQRIKQLHQRTMEGDYRIMRGYLLRAADQQMQETETGMIRFIDADLMAQGKHCERQVNVRTIKALTFKLTKYVLK